MKKISEYKIVANSGHSLVRSLSEMEREINDLIRDGFQPLGDLERELIRNDMYNLYQVMVKYESVSEKF